MASLDLSSPSIFDRLLSFGVPPRKQTPAPQESTHRFYACQEKPAPQKGFVCTASASAALGQKALTVSRGCPEWNDSLVLSYKLGAPVEIQKNG